MTETKARAGEALPAAQNIAAYPSAEVKSAMVGFMNAFKGFQDDVNNHFNNRTKD